MVAAIAPLLGPGVTAVGIGAAGLVDHATGTLVWSPHASGGGVTLGPEVAAATGLPVPGGQRRQPGRLAEARLGAGAGYRMVLFVGLGTGIGGGLVVEGRVERGRGFLGELGHMALDPSGPLCPCGRRGLLGGPGVGHRPGPGRRGVGRRPTRTGPVARAAAGAAAAGRAPGGRRRRRRPGGSGPVCAAAGAWLGRGLANLVAVLDPDVIVVGGAAAGAGEALLGPARAVLAEVVEGGGTGPPRRCCRPASARSAGLVGAALAAGEAT